MINFSISNDVFKFAEFKALTEFANLQSTVSANWKPLYSKGYKQFCTLQEKFAYLDFLQTQGPYDTRDRSSLQLCSYIYNIYRASKHLPPINGKREEESTNKESYSSSTVIVSESDNNHQSKNNKTILALDLGTTTGWAVRDKTNSISSGSISFKPQRFEGGGMLFLKFKQWLTELKNSIQGIDAIYFEEVRRHLGTDAAHKYGGFMAHLTAWCEHHQIPYLGIPVGTIKKHITGKGNASKANVIAAIKTKGFNPEDDNEADALALLDFVLANEITGDVKIEEEL